MHTRDIWNICLQTCRNNRICWRVAYFVRKIQTSQAREFPRLRIRDFQGIVFYMNSNIQWHFQICVSVPSNYANILWDLLKVTTEGIRMTLKICFKSNLNRFLVSLLWVLTIGLVDLLRDLLSITIEILAYLSE